MPRIENQLEQKYDISVHPLSSSSPPVSRISPVVLLVIVILAVIFFIFGLLHLLVRFLMKKASFSPISQSNRYHETSNSHSFQRQLQQLFRLHDSGLDQALVDALPVFYYNDIKGLKEPFDCAVCLCEFSVQDKLRLIPKCSHAFHINCIDTWLLSNSTCPICRGALNASGPIPIENPLFDFNESKLQLNGFSSDVENEFSCGENRVLSVRLGKLRGLESGGETSSCNLDARRCYSMGSFQYVVGDSDLQVALSNVSGNGGDVKFLKARCENGNSARNGDVEGKKISGRTKCESLSVSKVWLWSKKGKFPNSCDTSIGISSLHSSICQ